ncbi:IucA/IucC family protein [Aureimonas sp. AU40]|uniref:IucA/IucC family protein n=1 Tax=Aureimonas sp. AU40 TaxID=1637747 RepID=UPI000785EF9B|nr:IucA/IucC family protein [Aureimonas sp. AU40]
MSDTSEHVAEMAAFRSFANGYLREIDTGIGVRHALPDGPPAACVEWALPEQRALLRAELRSPSLCGAHGFGRLWTRQVHEPRWRLTAPMEAIQLLLREAYARVEGPESQGSRGRELALLGRILDSYRETARQVALRQREPLDETDFIGAERALLFGHWLHPTPKSRHGLTDWQARRYGPEEGGTFQLAVFAADRSLVRQDSAAGRTAEAIALDLLGEDAATLPLRSGEVALPMHPLQAEALLLQLPVEAAMASGALRLLGPFGPRFAATSSLRTVYAPEAAWMAKFSLPVTLTNSLRVNRLAELEAGVAMARLRARLPFAASVPQFHVIADPAYLTLALPGCEESGFETVFRENPFRDGSERGIAAIAALTAEPLPDQLSLLERLVRGLCTPGGERPATVARRWFELYLDCCVEPVIALYDRHGIALEAHQQNALVDVSSGWPSRGFYRDNQGFYLSEAARPRLEALVPELSGIASLFFDDQEIRRRLSYYLVVNQLFSVVARLGQDGLADEADLLARLAARVERIEREARGPGRAFARALLDAPALFTKANMRTRLQDRDELASGDGCGLYRPLPNPLAKIRERALDALAS